MNQRTKSVTEQYLDRDAMGTQGEKKEGKKKKEEI